MTPLVRGDAKLHLQFFTALAVVKFDDTKQLVRDFMEDKSWRHIPKDDVRHIVDRISAFPDDQRLYFGHAHLLGISAQLLADMPLDQRDRLFRNLIAPVFDSASIIVGMVNGKALSLVTSSIAKFEFTSRAFPVLLQRCLANRGTFFVLKTLTPPAIIEKLAERSSIIASPDLWYVIDQLCPRLWEMFDNILSADFTPPTNDAKAEAKRKAWATHVLEECRDRESFVKQLKEDCRRNLDRIRESASIMENYLPKELIVLVDSRSAFESETMLLAWLRSADMIEQLQPAS